MYIVKIIDMNKQSRKEQAYSGKYINYKGKLHTLVPEQSKGLCKGCDLYECSCPDTITKLCTQGYILKKVNL